MFKKIREAMGTRESKLSLEAVQKMASQSAKKILARPEEELKEALLSRHPGKEEEISQLTFDALFDALRADPDDQPTHINAYLNSTVALHLGGTLNPDISNDWLRILEGGQPVVVGGNIAPAIEAFATGDRDALQQAITPLDAAGIEAAHETIGLLLERFWSGRVVIELQGVPNLDYITNRQFVGNLESFHEIFEQINNDPRGAMDSLEKIVPEAAEVNRLANDIRPALMKLTGKEISLGTYLDSMKSMLGSGLQRGAIEPKDITPFMSDLKVELKKIKDEQDEEKQKALLGALGKKIKEKFPKMLSGIWDKVKVAGGLLGTGLLVWGAAFAFYLPIYLMDKVEKEVKPFGK